MPPLFHSPSNGEGWVKAKTQLAAYVEFSVSMDRMHIKRKWNAFVRLIVCTEIV